MANLFLSVPMPTTDGVGAGVDVTGMGALKTIAYQGNLRASVEVQCSSDNVNWLPLFTFSGPGKRTLAIATAYLRARVSNSSGGVVSPSAGMDVGSDDAGTQVATPAVPAGNGVGAQADVSALGTLNTVHVAGTFTGNVIIEISEDGTDWTQAFTFGSGGGVKTKRVYARYARVRREVVVPGMAGSPVVAIAAANDPGTKITGAEGVVYKTGADTYAASDEIPTGVGTPVNAAADGATVTFDCSLSNIHSVTLGGNRTLALSNARDGQVVQLILVQDGTGGRTVTWPASFLWPGGTAPTLSTAAGAKDVVSAFYDGTNWYGVVQKAFA